MAKRENVRWGEIDTVKTVSHQDEKAERLWEAAGYAYAAAAADAAQRRAAADAAAAAAADAAYAAYRRGRARWKKEHPVSGTIEPSAST